MTGADFVYPVLASIAVFVGFMSLPLLAMAMLHMIGKTS